MLPTLPEGWQQRLVRLEFENGVTGWFLDPNDAAISKYVRAEPRDREWIRAGLDAGKGLDCTIRALRVRFEDVTFEYGNKRRLNAAILAFRSAISDQAQAF